MKKIYCLVVIDDFSRFSWVFFLATKDETSRILKAFITGIENLIDHKVKIIRCDNETEFKNKEMNIFCEKQGKARVETVLDKDYILLPLWTQDPLFSFSSKDSPGDGFKPSREEEKRMMKIQRIKIMSPTANAASIKDNVVDKNIVYRCADDPNMPNLEEIVYSDDDEDVDTEAGMNNLDTNILFSPILTTRIHKDHLVEQIIRDIHSAPQTRRMTKSVTNHGFKDPEFPDRVYKVEKALYGLHQAPRAWYETLSTYLLDNGFHRGLQVTPKDDGIFTSQDKYVDEILKKFSFLTIKTASTPMETSKPLMKDKNAEDVDLHLYRSMIGSLMNLTSLKPDIMFVVSYTDSDYAGANLDRKSITEGCQFLRSRLISWQCKKQTVVANSTTEAEYIAASNCCG
nr:ribonuclease H-like domain, reverse transcriptase, RNA-dependent DNA polymerase [Tanacetum cinerariifolium]